MTASAGPSPPSHRWSSCCGRRKNFLVCNRGVILNMDKVLRLDGDAFEMLDGTHLPVRLKDKNTLFAQFTQYQFRHMRREL